MTVYNFSAGPARLPKAVMERVQAEFCDYQGSGSGIVELSHRGKYFAPVIERAEANIRELMGISDDYAVCFVQGGASMQFAMLAMNLLNGGTADYVDTGVWSSKAAKEAKLYGTVNIVASSKESKYDHIPAQSEWKLTPGAAYMHITSNNTIAGTQYQQLPKAPAGVPLIADMSSDIMSRVFDMNKFGIVFAGAQKNMGPSGVALVVIRKDLADRCPETVPTMLRYSTHIKSKSLFNTPNTFGIYIIRLVTDWMLENGGVPAIQAINERKAAKLYAAIDNSNFFRGTCGKADRSKMNVCFRIGDGDEELEKKFVAEAKEAGLIGLKGHRAVGGLRASIYNAMPEAGIDTLISFMNNFAKNN